MNKRCIIKIEHPPVSPSEHFEQIWVDSRYWVSSIFYDENLSFNQWKLNQLKSYEWQCNYYEYNNYYLIIVPADHYTVTATNVVEYLD